MVVLRPVGPRLQRGLEQFDGVVVLGDRVGPVLGVAAVQRVDLLAQRRALQGPTGLASLGRRQPPRPGRLSRPPERVRQRRARQFWAPAAGRAVVLAGVLPGDTFVASEHAGVQPGPGEHRRQVGRLVQVRVCARGGLEHGQVLGVPVLDHAEAAELAFEAVVVPMVVGVPGGEPVPVNPVDGFDSFDDVDRERQPGDPRPPGRLVGQVELGGWRVADLGLGAEVVGHAGEQVGLARGHQVDVAQLAASIAGQRRGPDQARGAVAEQVGHRDVGHAVQLRERLRQGVRPAVPVAGLVEVHPRSVGMQVDEVRAARAVDVAQPNAPLVEVPGLVHPRAAVHAHLGAELPEAGVGPVADLAVAHPDQVR